MKKFLKLAVAMLFVTALAACAGAQEYAGMNTLDITFSEEGKPQSIKGRFGKESEDVKISGNIAEGKFEYEAKGNRAFEAFKTRAEAEVALYQMVKDFGPEVVKGLVDVAIKAISPVP